ncbi:MAG: hypothetical protein H7066_04980 [Cytophagaceae bacterium]|nr:hypothetical protein [Gemmatimonadaceae bacterium]
MRPVLSEAPADLGFAATVDGPFDVFFATGDASAQQASAQIAAAQQSATGSRASGHVGFNFAAPTLGLQSERYSFVALSTDPATFAAKGEWEMMLTAASGVEQRFHGDVICMSTVGNTTRLAGLIEKVWINNVQRPITGATHVIWTVVDNGEGQGATDSASPMFFNNAANAQLHCTVGFPPPQFPVQEGNVQVRP